MNVPDNLLYTKEHEWILIENGVATIGITDYAQQQLGDVVFVETPEVGIDISAMDSFGVVESVKTVSDLFSPVSGEIDAVNEELESSPELVNASPYDGGWILKVKMNAAEEAEQLLSSDDYNDYIEEEK